MISITRPDGRIESGDHVMIPLGIKLPPNVTPGKEHLYAVQGPGVRHEQTFQGTPEAARIAIELIEDAFTMGYEGAQRQMRVALGLESGE